jgi:hypothetical protein
MASSITLAPVALDGLLPTENPAIAVPLGEIFAAL